MTNIISAFQILNGRLNAQANLALDGSVYVELSASLTCAHVAVGDAVRLDASVTGKDTRRGIIYNRYLKVFQEPALAILDTTSSACR